MTTGRDNPLVMALAGNEDDIPPLRLRTASIKAFSKASTPWTATVLMGGIDIPGITMLGYYDPAVGDIVQILQQGSTLVILGALAPSKIVAVAPPAPPAPPPTPTPPPAITQRTVLIAAIDSASWQSQYSTWRDDFIQGGSSGNWRRAFWFYGTQIAAAKGAGTIIGGTIFIKRGTSGGVYGVANVRLGTHNNPTRPGSGTTPHNWVQQVAQLAKGQGASIALPAGIIASLNAGASGLGLEPGTLSYSSPDYLPSYGRQAGEWSGQLSLTIQG